MGAGETSPPDLLPGVSEWLLAFWELGTDRQIGMGLGPIPNAAITAFTAGWDADEARVFRECMRRVDTAYRRAVESAQDGKSAPTKKMSPEIFDAMFG